MMRGLIFYVFDSKILNMDKRLIFRFFMVMKQSDLDPWFRRLRGGCGNRHMQKILKIFAFHTNKKEKTSRFISRRDMECDIVVP